MALFSLVPTRGIDSGTIFLRDRDYDGITHTIKNDVSLLVTDLYDFEMQLLMDGCSVEFWQSFCAGRVAQR